VSSVGTAEGALETLPDLVMFLLLCSAIVNVAPEQGVHSLPVWLLTSYQDTGMVIDPT